MVHRKERERGREGGRVRERETEVGGGEVIGEKKQM